MFPSAVVVASQSMSYAIVESVEGESSVCLWWLINADEFLFFLFFCTCPFIQ